MANQSILYKTGIIYMLIAPNGERYIGQTIQEFNNRLYQHVKLIEFYPKIYIILKRKILIKKGMKFVSKNIKKFLLESNF
jgi:hypothetical protein